MRKYISVTFYTLFEVRDWLESCLNVFYWSELLGHLNHSVYILYPDRVAPVQIQLLKP